MYKETFPIWNFSQPCCNRIFSNCLSHQSPAKRWPNRFRSRGTTVSSILDHDLGHLCRGRRIQMSGHSDCGILNNLWASSILLGYKPILHQLLVLHKPAVWRWYPWLLLLSFEKLMALVQWILHEIQNHLSQYHLGVQFDLCILGVLSPSFLLLTFVRFDAENFSNFSQSFVHCCFCCRNFHGLVHRNIFVNQIVMLLWIVSYSCNMVLMMIR